MGHGIPYPYSRIFMNLIHARDKNLITLDQAQTTWECVCEAWKRDNPRSYEK